jgi:hypothetical protein
LFLLSFGTLGSATDTVYTILITMNKTEQECGNSRCQRAMIENDRTGLLPRAYYSAPVAGILASTPETILGFLVANSQMAVEPPQRDAWLEEIAILKTTLQGLDGTLFLEFNIPRMGRRIDAVVVAGAMVFVIEFKVGEKHFTRADPDQAWDYALDLRAGSMRR